MPAGRPTDYSEELADRIAQTLVDADCGLERLCDETPGFPAGRTVWTWLSERDEFRRKITHAKERQFERMLYDGVVNIDAVDPEGRSGTARVAKVKASADARFKLAGKILPRKYGDKHDLNLGGQAGNPVETKDASDWEFVSAEDRQALQEIKQRAREAKQRDGK